MKTTNTAKSMRLFHTIYSLSVLAGLALFFLAGGCSGKSTPDAQDEARLKALEASAPGVGTIMSSVQLHFAKLYFAGKAQKGLERFSVRLC